MPLTVPRSGGNRSVFEFDGNEEGLTYFHLTEREGSSETPDGGGNPVLDLKCPYLSGFRHLHLLCPMRDDSSPLTNLSRGRLRRTKIFVMSRVMAEHPLRVWRGSEHTLAALAKRAKMSKSYLSEIETCRTEPSFSTIRKLSKITGIPSGMFVDFQPRKDRTRGK